MNVAAQRLVHGFTEFSERIGEGTEFAATLTVIPDDDADGDLEWRGHVKFDNDLFNWKHAMHKYNDEPFTFYLDWVYPNRKSGGAYMMNLLVNWHASIVEFIQDIRKAHDGRN